MNTCPHCQRKLITHASAKCNWCGVEIQDADYQQNAQTARDAFFVEQAEHDAISQARIRNINVFGNDPQLYSYSNAPINPRTVRGRALRYPPIARKQHPINPQLYQDNNSTRLPQGFQDVKPEDNEPPSDIGEQKLADRFNRLELG